MNIDKLIQQRLSELEKKASAIEKTQEQVPREDYYVSYVNPGKFKGWATSVLALLQRVFGEDSIHYKNFCKSYQDSEGFLSEFEQCREIFRAAKEDYENGYLFNVRSQIKAEDSTDILEQATALLDAGYKDPACVVAGIALELTVKELCTRNGITHAKLDAMNIELCKKHIYNMGMQKQITTWSHWRNKAAHGEWSEYTDADVKDMITGVTRFVANHL